MVARASVSIPPVFFVSSYQANQWITFRSAHLTVFLPSLPVSRPHHFFSERLQPPSSSSLVSLLHFLPIPSPHLPPSFQQRHRENLECVKLQRERKHDCFHPPASRGSPPHALGNREIFELLLTYGRRPIQKAGASEDRPLLCEL